MSKIALITGASRGIGAATARRLADEGYDVCVNYRRDKAGADAVLRAIAADHPVRAIAVQADVAREDEVERLFRAVDEQLGRVSAMVNNAAILRPQMRVAEMDAQRINDVFASNVTGVFTCCREAVRRMSRAHGGEGGAIVNVSSVAARLGAPNEYVDYAASKGAVDALTIGLAKEVAAEGIRVNCVRPGFIYTDMHADGGEPGRVDRIKAGLPLGRGGQPHEVAAAVAWLLSDDAAYTTGTFIEVAGGR
ncbi:MAG: SDR family oxidoreductase [Pseudomonadota bacterium]